MKLAQPLVMMTIWKPHACGYQPVPSAGGISGLALTRWQTTWPPVASAMPRSRYRKKSRKPPPVNSVSPGLTWENSLTTACRFIMASIVLVDAIAAIARSVQFFGSAGFRVHSFIVLCENRARRAAPRRFRRPLLRTHRNCWSDAEIRGEGFCGRLGRRGGAVDASARDGTKLSKACPMLGPCKRAARRARCLIFNLELFDVVRLGFGGLDPFLHLGHHHDDTGIGRQSRVQLHVIGQESGHYRRIHGVRHGALAEQERSPGFGQAFAPDRADPIDIGLRARPDLETGEKALQVDPPRRPPPGEPPAG